MPKRWMMKFGGTSVGGAAAIQKVASIVAQTQAELSGELLIVVSAMQGVTDQLQTAADLAAVGDQKRLSQLMAAIRRIHMVAAQDISGTDSSALAGSLDAILTRLENEIQGLPLGLQRLDPAATDRVLCVGEKLSSILVAEALGQTGLSARAVDAAEFVVTNDHFLNATPDLQMTRQRSREVLLPLLEDGIIPVITGFNGATEGGVPTTLGRGGSDLSAALIGASLDCDEVWIWTDVDGVMSADPRIVPDAHNVDALTFEEVSELAYFGAKVLHPRTILPLREIGTPLRVKNTFNPNGPATSILPDISGNGHGIKAVTAVPHLSLITLQGTGMLGVPGIAGRTFAAVGQVGANVLLISQASSEQTLCFAIPDHFTDQVVGALNDEFESELQARHIDRIWSKDEVTIVTAVGSGIRSTPGIAGEVFRATGQSGVNAYAIAQGSSECSLSLVVDSAQGEAAVRAIHPLTQRKPSKEGAIRLRQPVPTVHGQARS